MNHAFNPERKCHMCNPRKSQIIQTDLCAENDPRSVSAMLRGKGDGREKLYAVYARHARLRNPQLTDLDLTEMYARDARNPCLIGKLRLIVAISSMGYQVFGVGAAYLILRHFFG